jgi:hypothetical protein
MSKKNLLIIFLLSAVTYGYAQSSLNDYKYVIVPTSYDFLNEKDKYQLNTLTKYSLDKYGFQTVMEDAIYPEDLLRNNCLALRANIVKLNAILKTKIVLELTNCKKEVIFATAEGTSREKSHKIAYNLALRQAVKSFERVNYKYVPNENILTVGEEPVATNTQKEIAQLKDEIKTLKADKVAEKPNVENKTPLQQDEVLQTDVQTVASNLLLAKETPNGLDLFNNNNLIYTLKKTGMSNVYLVDGKSALVYQDGKRWILEYYKNSELLKEELNIKF